MPNCNEKNNYKNIKKQGVSDWDQLDSVDTVVDSHTVTVWQPVSSGGCISGIARRRGAGTDGMGTVRS